MKRKYIVSTIAALASILMMAMTACSPALSDREAYDEGDRTGVITSAADLVRVLNGEMRGIIGFPQEVAGSDCTGFCGAINSVSNIYGTQYTDQQGSLFGINENHYVTAPLNEDDFPYYNSEDNMLVWFMIKNNNAGRTSGLKYAFPMELSGTFILNATGSLSSNAVSGQYAGLTMGFIDSAREQNGGMLVKVIENGAYDKVILQLPDVSTALEDEMGFINIPHTRSGSFIEPGRPFTITLEVVGNGTSSSGPTIRLRYSDSVQTNLLLLPEDENASFNGSTYANYVSNSVVWGLIAISLGSNPGPKVWDMLWSGGELLGNPVPGCISAITENIVLACDLGVSGTPGTSNARSAQLLNMSIDYQGPTPEDY